MNIIVQNRGYFHYPRKVGEHQQNMLAADSFVVVGFPDSLSRTRIFRRIFGRLVIQACSVAERKFEIAAGAVYVDVPRIEYVGERLQDRPELEFVIVVFYIFCDFCANALDLDGNGIIIGFAGHRDLYQ